MIGGTKAGAGVVGNAKAEHKMREEHKGNRKCRRSTSLSRSRRHRKRKK